MKLKFANVEFPIVGALRSWKPREDSIWCNSCRHQLHWRFKGSTPVGIGCRCGSRSIKLIN